MFKKKIKEITSELESIGKEDKVHKWTTIKPEINEIKNMATI